MLLVTGLAGQDRTTAELRSYVFSEGVHATFAVDLDGIDARTAEAHWRNVLKEVSMKVGGGKELVGIAARIPSITSDTVRILAKGVQVRGVPMTTMHVAFLTTRGTVGADADSAMVRACRQFVERHNLSLRQAHATGLLQAAERTLERMKREENILKRDHDRFEDQQRKAWERDTVAKAEQVRLAAELQQSEARSVALQAAMQEGATEEDLQERKALDRELARQRKALDRATRAEANAIKRAGLLTDALRRNEAAQVAKAQEIERQSAMVAELRERLERIH